MEKNYYSDKRTVVRTDAGLLRGAYLNGVYIFRGIPYARTERFLMPEPAAPWEGVRDAVSYGRVAPTIKKPDCVGMASVELDPLLGFRYRPEGEDCLSLNVWTRDISGREEKKPVMVWIHGGGYSTGSSVELVSYEGANLCRGGDVIVVSLNHRLNILGYLDLSDFGEKYANSGNAGMADIVEALRWVRRNIAAFGGDPDNVTLFGQSGGGGKIMTLLQMPVADSLYHRVIIQSGMKPEDCSNEKKLADSPKVGAAVAAELGLTKETIDEIRTVSFERLRAAYLKVQPGLEAQGLYAGWGPVPNGYFTNALLNGAMTEKTKHTPMIVGTTAAEQCLWVPRFVNYDKTEEEKMALLRGLYGDGTEEMLRLFQQTYPRKDLMHLYHMDCLFRRTTLHFLERRAQAGTGAYAYLLDFDFAFDGVMPSFHSAEMPMVFNNTELVDAYNEPDAQALGETMSAAWAAFAHDGDPNVQTLPAWKPYRTEGKYTMIFGRSCALKDNFDWALQEAHQKYHPLRVIQDIFRKE